MITIAKQLHVALAAAEKLPQETKKNPQRTKKRRRAEQRRGQRGGEHETVVPSGAIKMANRKSAQKKMPK